jgi:putative transposase
MSNHFNLLLRPDSGQAVGRIMQSLMVAHTWHYHKRYGSVGHVWQGRFKSPVIQDDRRLLTVLRYIEANPLRARIVEDLASYRWSSFPAHARGVADPLLDSLPEYECLGRTPAERRARWVRKVQARQPETELKRIPNGTRAGTRIGEDELVRAPAETLGIEFHLQRRRRLRKREKGTDTKCS